MIVKFKNQWQFLGNIHTLLYIFGLKYMYLLPFWSYSGF